MNGACQESLHVFIDAGLSRIPKQRIRVFEVGFGTGLNALLTWEKAVEKGLFVQYITTEAHPIPASITESLRFKPENSLLLPESLQLLHTCEWEKENQLSPHFSLLKTKADFTEMTYPDQLDLVYYDAFSPDKQPEMWEEEIFQKLFEKMNAAGLLVTYCAKGEIRRRMQRSGFSVERIPGPPGKREMLRAQKP